MSYDIVTKDYVFVFLNGTGMEVIRRIFL